MQRTLTARISKWLPERTVEGQNNPSLPFEWSRIYTLLPGYTVDDVLQFQYLTPKTEQLPPLGPSGVCECPQCGALREAGIGRPLPKTGLTLQQAAEALKAGQRITHRDWAEGHWVSAILPGGKFINHEAKLIALNHDRMEDMTDAAWSIYEGPETPAAEEAPKPLTFGDPPAGHAWHNPDNLTPEQVGVDKGWRLCLESEGRHGDLQDFIFGWWTLAVNRDPDDELTTDRTYRTKAPLPEPKKEPSAPVIPAFIERMTEESTELETKRKALKAFIASDAFNGLSHEDKGLMHAQEGAMQAYSVILRLRRLSAMRAFNANPA